MIQTNSKVDNYLAIGCGRCSLVGTPQCKVQTWQEELELLRTILLDCQELREELKWSHPCYTFQNKNIILLGAFKDFCSINFINGVLLKDEKGILVSQTENVQASRIVKFTNPAQIMVLAETLKMYILEAIEIEKKGIKVEYKTTAEFEFPDELLAKFEEMPAFKNAFYALTPGRQRGYLLHFAAPKQAQTRIARIEKNLQNIFAGKGINDK